MINIEKILPVYKVENNAIVSMQGDITIAYKVTLPELFTQSANDYEAQHQAWVKAIRGLPRHSIIHKQDRFMAMSHKGNPGQGKSFLAEAGERYFEGRP